MRDDEALVERVRYIHNELRTDALAEHYIDGRELYVGVLGNYRLQVLPVWEMLFANMPEDVPRMATGPGSSGTSSIRRTAASPRTPRRTCRRPCSRKSSKRANASTVRINMSGYARLDLRLRADGRIFVLEANANPNLAYGEDFAESAEVAGITYEKLLQRIISLGLAYRAPWKTA